MFNYSRLELALSLPRMQFIITSFFLAVFCGLCGMAGARVPMHSYMFVTATVSSSGMAGIVPLHGMQA